MLRTNRSIAPVGMALLSLSLGAVPFLLNTSWTDLQFGSRLTSVTSAWNQVASVFLAVYQPANAAQLLALEYSTEDRGSSPAKECSGHAEEVACLGPADGAADSDKASGVPVEQPSTELLWTEQTADAKVPTECPRAAANVPLPRYRAAVATKSLPVARINLPRIDVLKIIEVAMKSEAATKLFDKHLADYRIQTKFEFTRMATRSSMPAVYRPAVKPDAPRCESEPASAPRPDVPTKGKLRKARVAFELESQS